MNWMWSLWRGLKRLGRKNLPTTRLLLSQQSDRPVEEKGLGLLAQNCAQSYLFALALAQQQSGMAFAGPVSPQSRPPLTQGAGIGGPILSRGLQELASAPAPEKPRRFVAGPLVGYRYWRLTNEGVLQSLATSFVWPTQATLANCTRIRPYLLRPEHNAPFAGCTCGYWAFKKLPSGDPLSGGFHEPATCFVSGRVALWGVRDATGGGVIPTEKGYRAQYAYPLSLAYYQPTPGWPPKTPLAAQALELARQRYGCEIEEDGIQ